MMVKEVDHDVYVLAESAHDASRTLHENGIGISRQTKYVRYETMLRGLSEPDFIISKQFTRRPDWRNVLQSLSETWGGYVERFKPYLTDVEYSQFVAYCQGQHLHHPVTMPGIPSGPIYSVPAQSVSDALTMEREEQEAPSIVPVELKPEQEESRVPVVESRRKFKHIREH